MNHPNNNKEGHPSVFETNYVEWGGFLNEFLWSCAGVNKKVIRQCPTDYAKYAGSGGTILFTALMAMLSGGYAMFFVFHEEWIACAFGVFWGLLIFNLDRYIVNTMYSDGKPTISWLELRSGLPRIIMAIFLGIVISTPLEMKIFEDRIDSQLVLDNQNRTNKTMQASTKANQVNIDRRNQLEKEHNNITARLAKANQELQLEGEGAALSGKVGHGPIYEDKKANRDAIQKELEDWTRRYSAELENLNTQIASNTERTQQDVQKGNKENGFCVRYEAFSHIKEDNVSLEVVSLVIMLLFIIIETAPTFFKMMMSSGPYDDLLRAEMHRVRVLSDKQISDINDMVNTAVTISVAQNEERRKAEMEEYNKTLGKIAAVQGEILGKAIESWREQELKKVEENPSAYIHSAGSSQEVNQKSGTL